jgi:hypothetical protein
MCQLSYMESTNKHFTYWTMKLTGLKIWEMRILWNKVNWSIERIDSQINFQLHFKFRVQPEIIYVPYRSNDRIAIEFRNTVKT